MVTVKGTKAVVEHYNAVCAFLGEVVIGQTQGRLQGLHICAGALAG